MGVNKLNKGYWNALFQKLDSMSEEEFLTIIAELDVLSDVPFAIGEEEDKEVTNA